MLRYGGAEREVTVSMKTQREMFYEAHKRLAAANEMFLEFVQGGMTRQELERLIHRRPSLWARFSNWLDVLPSAGE